MIGSKNVTSLGQFSSVLGQKIADFHSLSEFLLEEIKNWNVCNKSSQKSHKFLDYDVNVLACPMYPCKVFCATNFETGAHLKEFYLDFRHHLLIPLLDNIFFCTQERLY